MRIRLSDVADLAGVSKATASLVLNDKADSIGAAAVERVISAAEELGYRPNTLAKSLRQQRSHTVGFLSDQVVTTPYAGGMIVGAEAVANSRGFALILANIGQDENAAKSAIDALLDRQIDAIIYATMYHQVVDVPPQLQHIPTVLLNARSEVLRCPSVVPDDYSGAEAAVEHLIAVGHRRIGFINDQDDVPAAYERRQAYLDVLTHHGLDHDPALEGQGSSDPSGGRDAAEKILGRLNRPTALFCFNDRMASGAYIAARQLGIEVPEDLSIVGFDNQILVAEAVDPPLTSVQLPHVEMGRWAMEQALALLDEEAEPQLCRMPCPLVERGSVAPPRQQ